MIPPSLHFLNFILFALINIFIWGDILPHVCGGQMTIGRIGFLFLIMWVYETECRSSGLVASTFPLPSPYTHSSFSLTASRQITQAQNQFDKSISNLQKPQGLSFNFFLIVFNTSWLQFSLQSLLPASHASPKLLSSRYIHPLFPFRKTADLPGISYMLWLKA